MAVAAVVVPARTALAAGAGELEAVEAPYEAEGMETLESMLRHADWA